MEAFGKKSAPFEASLSALSFHGLRFKLLGLSMAMAVGPLCEVSAYAFAPQPLGCEMRGAEGFAVVLSVTSAWRSLLAPLDGFDVIWNILPRTHSTCGPRREKTQD